MSLPGKLQKISSMHSIDWSELQTHKSSFWFQIEDIWYHKSVMRNVDIWSANIIITKDSDGVFKYVKCRGKNRVPNQPLNEEELKEMAWIILSAEKA